MVSRHVRIAPGGRVAIPAEFRKALGVSVGDDLVTTLEDGELRLRSFDAAIRRAQEIVRRYIPDESRSLADELIAERQEETAREQQE